MKKILSCLFVVVFTLSCFSMAVQAAGDGISSATPIHLNEEYNGVISVTNYKDYYKIILSESGRVSVSVSAQMRQACAFIYDEKSKEVYRNYEMSESNLIQINNVIDLVSGTYYFCFSSWEGYTGTYSFSLLFESAQESFMETQSQDNSTEKRAEEGFARPH